jgi:hypothetical protein
MVRRAATAALAAASLAACGSASAALGAQVIALPTAPPAALGATTVDTSPDGGIYRNPLRLTVILVGRADARTLGERLGGAAAGWSPLQRFGPFTVVGFRLRNLGKAFSDPDVVDLQVASDYAPAGTASGPLRHFYHPTYPLAALSDLALGDACRPHLDPGQSATVVLVYPPVTAQGTLVWGRYREFALRLPFAGGVGTLLDGRLHAMACPPPAPPPP